MTKKIELTDENLSNEATPQDHIQSATPLSQFGLQDSKWTAAEWKDLVMSLADTGMTNWKEIASILLGSLNPSQTGTSLASSTGFKRRYGKGNTMRIVMSWAYSQTGRCVDCGSRLGLQADHVKPRESYDDPLDADFIDNMVLRCRRCNVIRRPSHAMGGQTHLTAESALMWILLTIRPRTLKDFVRMCRLYGMTMADIRMQEAWAMAHWLSKETPPKFGIENDSENSYDILHWDNGSITRVDVGYEVPTSAKRLATKVQGDRSIALLAEELDGRKKLYVYAIADIAFSTYNLGDHPPYALAIQYSAADKKRNKERTISFLPPAGRRLVSHVVFNSPEEHLALSQGKNQMPITVPSSGSRFLPSEYQNMSVEIIKLAN